MNEQLIPNENIEENNEPIQIEIPDNSEFDFSISLLSVDGEDGEYGVMPLAADEDDQGGGTSSKTGYFQVSAGQTSITFSIVNPDSNHSWFKYWVSGYDAVTTKSTSYTFNGLTPSTTYSVNVRGGTSSPITNTNSRVYGLNSISNTVDTGGHSVKTKAATTTSYTITFAYRVETAAGGWEPNKNMPDLTQTYQSGASVDMSVWAAKYTTNAAYYNYSYSSYDIGGETSSFKKFTVDRTRTVYLHYKRTRYGLYVAAGTGGTVKVSTPSNYSNGISCRWGQAVSATATANSGYRFDAWYAHNPPSAVVGNSTSFSGTVYAQTTYFTATFVKTYIYKADKCDGDTGIATLTPSSTATADAGTKVTVSCTLNNGYEFVGWYDSPVGGTPLSSSQSYSFTLNANTYCYAKTKKLLLVYKAAGKYQDTDSTNGIKSVSGGGSVNNGTYVQVSCELNDGYDFDGWYLDPTDSSTRVSTSQTYGFYISSNTYLYARAKKKTTYGYYALKVTNDAGIKSVEPANITTKYAGTSVYVNCSLNTGYRFLAWYSEDSVDDNYFVSSNQKYTFTLNKNTILYAASVRQYNIGVGYYSGCSEMFDSININKTSPVDTGTSVTWTAKVKDGYTFMGWYSSENSTGSPVSTSTTYTITVTSDKTLYARARSKRNYFSWKSNSLVASKPENDPIIANTDLISTYLKKTKWDLLQQNINEIQALKGVDQTSFTKAVIGAALTHQMYNDCMIAICDMCDYPAESYKVKQNDPITALSFNRLQNFLNSISV